MYYPYSNDYDESIDQKLVDLAITGSGIALEELLQRYQSFIYNIAFRMVLSPYDAEDITQEILIKIFTKIGSFQGNSSFRTWVNKITVNHVLNMKKKWLEERYNRKEMYEEELDNISVGELYGYSDPERQVLFEEARLGCLAGMLLCLTREQRIIYILGEIFEIPGDISAEVLDIMPATYRKKLSRAKNDLYQFMNEKCGLVNRDNPCRCANKTRGFIAEGWVDPQNMKFYDAYSKKISECIQKRDNQLKSIEGNGYKHIMQEFPYIEKKVSAGLVQKLLSSKPVKEIFDL